MNTHFTRLIASLFLISTALVAWCQLQQQTSTDWSSTWHGQEFSVGYLSRGRALKGEHFDNKYNRIEESPWNAAQVLLGRFLVAKLTEAHVESLPESAVEKLVTAQCRAVMAMLSTSQQLYEGHVVYQLDDWRQAEPIASAIWGQTTAVKALIQIPPDREERLRNFLKMEFVPAVSPGNYALRPKTTSLRHIRWSVSGDSRFYWSLMESARRAGLVSSEEWSEMLNLIAILDRALVEAKHKAK